MSLETLKRWASRSRSATSLMSLTGMDLGTSEAPKIEVHLPDEIILEILSHLPTGHPSSQRALCCICLINRQWYHVAVSRLYDAPYITGRNFQLLVRTLCPSINAHIRKSDLASLVHKLDLSRLVHHSTKATTARLLGRTKTNMVYFKAPAASFGLNCFAALSKCERLTTLDLSLVNDAIRMHSLAHAMKTLPHLERLAFPRSSLRNEDFDAANFYFPPSFKTLHVSGGITDQFLSRLGIPLVAALSASHQRFSLAISHCPEISSEAIYKFCAALGEFTVSLNISNVPKARQIKSLEYILKFCPMVEELSISSDYISFYLMFAFLIPPDELPETVLVNQFYMHVLEVLRMLKERGDLRSHPLKSLEITNSGYPNPNPEDMLRPRAILAALEYGVMANLRHISVSNKIGWDSTRLATETQKLVDRLDELAEDGETVEIAGNGERETGLFTFDD